MIATCDKCGAYVHTQLDVATRKPMGADIVPVTRQQYIDALLGGVETYTLTEGGRLRIRRIDSQPPAFESDGTQAGDSRVLRRHGCRDATYTKAAAQAQAEAPVVCDTWRWQGWVPPPGRCPRDRGVTSIKSCPTCEKPPFDLAGMGLGAPESLPRDSRHPTTPPRPPETALWSGKEQECPSPTAPAVSPGAAPAAPTAPAATKPSAHTGHPTSTASAPSASTAVAPTPPQSGSCSDTASGATRHLTRQSVRCYICDRLINQSIPFTGIHHGRWVWAVHDECP